MKITKIERRLTNVRKVIGSDYVVDGVHVIAQHGIIPHSIEYQTDFPDI